jgi:hypothetical protein
MPDFIPDYLLIGHIAHDVTPHGPSLGGTVSYGAHTAVALSQKVGILTSAKPDEPLLADLPAGVQVVSIPAEHTTVFNNRYVGSARTQYMYHRALTLTPAMLPPAWRRARLIHIAPIAYEVDPAFFTFFDQGAICVTPQGFMRHREPDGLVTTVHWADAEKTLPHARLTVFSEEDIRHDPSLEKTFARLAPVAVITRAERGGTVYQGDKVYDFKAIEHRLDRPGQNILPLCISLDRLGDLERDPGVAYLAGRRSHVWIRHAPDRRSRAWKWWVDS